MENKQDVDVEKTKQLIEAHPEILEAIIDSDDSEGKKSVIARMFSAKRYSGPIPPPELFREMEDIMEGSADRVLVLSEKNLDGMLHLRKETLAATINERSRGQNYGLIVSVLGCILVGYALHLGHATTAGILGVSIFGSLAIAFVTGRKRTNTSKNKS